MKYSENNQNGGQSRCVSESFADLNVVARSEFKLKPEQEIAVKYLKDGMYFFAPRILK